MKTFLLLAVVIVVVLLAKRLLAGSSISPVEAEKLVAAGEAVLIDVRGPSECAAGVAVPALLLPLDDLRGERRLWKPALENCRGKKIILYCASGVRSGVAAGILRREGWQTLNAGGYRAWEAAGLPVRKP